MTQMISTKPYMLRALHEWCTDNELTPHIVVTVNPQTRVPMAYVKDGEIVLNVNYSATKDLHIDNDSIVFSARFGGVAQHIYIPIPAVKGIFARETGQGMFFDVGSEVDLAESGGQERLESKGTLDNVAKKDVNKKPKLTIVK